MDENRFIDGITAIGKRGGLWVFDETPQGKSTNSVSWSEWCIMEDFQLDKLAYKTDITVDTTDIYILDGTCMDEMKQFNKFVADCGGYGKVWIELAKKYKGLAITPYNRIKFIGNKEYFPWDQTFGWHYTWDCASCVIWDYSCIQKIGKSVAFQCPNREDLIFF
ncbi:MAG: hypothetical protein SGARI_002987 [Bacillariaceae sp.]